MLKILTPVVVFLFTVSSFAVNPFTAPTTCAPCQLAAAFRTGCSQATSTVSKKVIPDTTSPVTTSFIPTALHTVGAGKVTWTLEFINRSSQPVEAQIQLRGFSNATMNAFRVMLKPGETKSRSNLISVGDNIPQATMVWNYATTVNSKSSGLFAKQHVSSPKLAGTYVGQTSIKLSNGMNASEKRELSIHDNLTAGNQKVTQRKGFNSTKNSLPNINQPVSIELKNHRQFSCTYDSVGETWGGTTRQFTLSKDGKTLSSTYYYNITSPALQLNGEQEVITGTGFIELHRVD